MLGNYCLCGSQLLKFLSSDYRHLSFGSREGEDEGEAIALHFTTTAVSDATGLLGSLRLEHTLEVYGENIISHEVVMDRENLD